MTMRPESVRLFQTLDHPCGYFEDRSARNLVIDPLDTRLSSIYETALSWGFRRSGGHVYRPNCRQCQACVPCRVPVDQFRPDRSQRRCLAGNRDTQVEWGLPSADAEMVDLYDSYLRWRHAGGGMDEPATDDFQRFLLAPWGTTRFLQVRLHGKLIAVAVTDQCANSLSAVYTFFCPTQARRSPGVFCILEQIAQARRLGLKYLYLGYWISGHPKMHYKSRYAPLEIQRDGHWHAFPGNERQIVP